MKVFDTFSEFHNKINLERIFPSYKPLIPLYEKVDSKRLSSSHVRKRSMKTFNLLSLEYEEKKQPLPPEFKNILEISCRAPYCPCPFVLDTMIGVCSYNCIYCFTALTISSLMTSFFDSDNPLAPRYANPESTKKYLTEILNARGVEPNEREKKEGLTCGNTTEEKILKKASAQRIPLRMGTRSENFLPREKEVGVALEALKVISDFQYPLIINTKSDLILQSPYFDLIADMGDNVAIQVSIIHNDDKIAKALEPFAPSSSKRWEVIKTFNEVGINAMPRMEPCANALNADDEHLRNYFEKAYDCGVKNFMGDTYHATVKAEEIRRLFYTKGFDFDKMWELTSEYQILGSYAIEHAMFHAKEKGIRAGTFNFHSLPYMDAKVCCMIDQQFENWNKFSMVHFIKNELIERTKVSWKELDEKYFGLELYPELRNRLKAIWNLEMDSPWSPDWTEGAIVESEEEGNVVWRFDPNLIGEGYKALIKMFGGERFG